MLRIAKLPIAVFALFIIALPWVAHNIPSIENYTDIMIFAGIYCLMTIGLSLLMGYAGQISIGHAAFYGIGAYTSAILTVHYGLNPWLCMFIGMIVSAIIAVLVGAPSLKLRGHYLAMATLAFGIIRTECQTKYRIGVLILNWQHQQRLTRASELSYISFLTKR